MFSLRLNGKADQYHGEPCFLSGTAQALSPTFTKRRFMQVKAFILKAVLVMALFPVLALMKNAFQQPPSAKAIVEKSEKQMKGNTSIMEVDIQVVRPTWTRTMKIKAWSKGDTFSMILVTAPAKDQGTVFLKRNKEVWNWVPSIERVIKLPPSMMTQSWMGTDFTNDDLVKESSMVNDYTQKIVGDTVIAQRKCWKIEMIPLPESAVVWGKIFLWIDQKDFLQLRAEFIDEDNKLVNVMQASDIKMLGGKLLPGRMEMTPVEKKGQKTVLITNSIVFNQPLSDDFFTVDNMKKVK